MNNKEPERKMKILLILFATYGQEDKEMRINAYADALADMPVDLLDKACRQARQKCQFLPSVAEIISAARSIKAEVTGERFKTWEEAWDEIEKAMYATPWGKTPTFSTPEIARAVKSFGWRTLQETLVADMPVVRAQLRQMYEQVCQRTSEKVNNEYVLGKNGTGLLDVRSKSNLQMPTKRAETALETSKTKNVRNLSYDEKETLKNEIRRLQTKMAIRQGK